VVHGGAEEKPGYLKMTFSTARQAVNGDRFLEMSKLIGSNGSLKPDATLHSNSVSTFQGSHKIPALMRKEMYSDDSAMLGGLTGGYGTTGKKRTRKEELIDKKIEHLLEVYKRQDQELLKKADGKSNKQREDRKKLRDKFGFSDDENEDGANQDEDEEMIPEDNAPSEGRFT
jgi:hypothetical protein